MMDWRDEYDIATAERNRLIVELAAAEKRAEAAEQQRDQYIALHDQDRELYIECCENILLALGIDPNNIPADQMESLAKSIIIHWREELDQIDSESKTERLKWQPVGTIPPPTGTVFTIKTNATIHDTGDGLIAIKAPWGASPISGGHQLCWWREGNDWQWKPKE